ncbi:MAG TPA: M48 family metalloprotease [Verrucomicrobiae bacterium]|nr:M48 family metalloprotease [Verrucomicrobiae bacterium]
MLAPKTLSWPGCVLFLFLAAGIVTGQDTASALPDTAQTVPLAPASKRIVFDDFVDSVIRQERRLTDWMRRFRPIVETYVQEEGSAPRFQKGTIPNGDDYFLSRLSLAGNSPSLEPFADEETWNQGAEKYFVHDELPFSQTAFAQALFPDFAHFDRENYTFEFVRWEVLGDVRCAAIDVRPHGNSKKRGFFGRIWAEDRNYSIVRFRGTFTARGLSRRAFHFDSWRLNTFGSWWMPAYVYYEESKPSDLAGERPWFKAQTRVWGYDLQNASDHREIANLLTDSPAWVDPNRESPAYIADETKSPPEEVVVERSQVAGLMAPDGEVDRILETVLNNLLLTNKLDIADLRCRVLLTTPLESFVIGRTIVLSRGLLDVLPDEATLAAVLAHELAHVILGQTVSSEYLTNLALPFPDSQIFGALDFHLDRAQEAAADKKGIELFSNSPYKDKLATVHLFVRALNTSSGRFPILLHGRFSNDFGNIHLAVMQAGADSSRMRMAERLDQLSALPLGSRIVIDPWTDQIELKSRPVRLVSKAEKIPFEVTPFYPHLRRVDATEKPPSKVQQ